MEIAKEGKQANQDLLARYLKLAEQYRSSQVTYWAVGERQRVQ